MSEDSSEDRDLPASEQKIRKAREEGNVPRSRDFGGGVVLMVGVVLLYTLGESLLAESKALLQSGLTLNRQHAFDNKLMGLQFFKFMEISLLILTPLFIAVYISALASNFLVGGLNWSGKSVHPNFAKLNPLSGLKNIFSVNGAVELIKALTKTIILGLVGYLLIKQDLHHLANLSSLPMEQALALVARITLIDTLILASIFLVLVSFDVPYQLWRYYKGLRMSLEELKRESKESEGDPHVKGRIRQMQRERARKRMMASVPNADVIVTNPTHYAVALVYSEQNGGAPKVVAKGMGLVALKIKEIAAASHVPIVEMPPLARALFAHVELEDEIPELLYTAVAKVLAHVYAGAKGEADFAPLPSEQEIPAHLDPLNHIGSNPT